MTIVRAATREDLDAVVDLEARLFGRAAWSRGAVEAEFAGLGETRHIVVAVEVRRVVGYAMLLEVADAADVHRIAVDADHRGSGIAHALLGALLDKASSTGNLAVLLEVAADNAAGLALYAKHGFVEIDRRPRYYPGDVDAVVMHKPLEPTS